jgi:putative acyl-CoA dehydrogenase
VHAAEALECLGGNGYIEEWPLARLYREAPLNSIWEGSGNIQCLDALRALQKAPESLAALFGEIALARGADHRLDIFVATLRDDLGRLDPEEAETRARHLVERLALALQGALLVRHAPPAVADAFCSSRLAGEGGRAFGTLPAGTDVEAILERAAPEG